MKVRQYTWRPNFILIEEPRPGKDYQLISKGDGVILYNNALGVTKFHLDPNYYPNFEYCAARLSISRVSELCDTGCPFLIIRSLKGIFMPNAPFSIFMNWSLLAKRKLLITWTFLPLLSRT